MSESDADKKRNKLGYQRISVACGHCRRRKIRCVMAEGDARNRCQNCIRLNKECVFYPVDQQLPTDKASSSSGKASATPIPASMLSHSPQEFATGRSFDQSAFPPSVPSVPSNVPQGYSGVAYGEPFQEQGKTTKALLRAKLTQGGADYGYRPSEYPRPWSGPEELTQQQQQAAMAGPVGGSQILAPGLGLYNQYSSDSMHSTPTETRSYSFPGPEDDRQWQAYQQQGRAMSYGNFEGIPTTYVQSAPVYTGVQMQGMTGSPFAVPQLDMQNVQMQMSGAQSAPVSATMQFAPEVQYGYPSGAQAPQSWYANQAGFDPYNSRGGDETSRRTQR